MASHYRSQPITSYRVLPPKWKIIEPEPPSASRYLEQADAAVREGQPELLYTASSDILSLVFDSQLRKHDLSSYQLASVIAERHALLQRHLDGIKWRLDDLMSKRPLRTVNTLQEGKLSDVDKQILDLEKQKRALELALWKDTHELRSELMTERIEREALRRRIGYLGGPAGGPHG
jgi:hypothetical protein